MSTALEKDESMLLRLKRLFGAIGSFLAGQYHRKPGFCASAGLSVEALEGRRPVRNQTHPDAKDPKVDGAGLDPGS